MTGIKIDGTQNKVVLDDDADTYFEAATDDTIKVYVAGAQDFTITANTLTAESGSTIAAQALTATTGAFTDNVTVTTNDTTDTLTLVSGDTGSSSAPNLLFNRNSSSPAANDFLGAIDFQGKNSAGDDHNYIRVLSRILSPTDGSETADLVFKDAIGNNILNMAASEVVFNDDSIERDFRVESNGNANALIVKGSNDRVGIGGGDASFGVLGVEVAGDCTVDLFSNVGSGTRGKIEIFFSTDSSSDHVSVGSIVAQQPSGDQASRKGEILFNVSDNGAPGTALTIANNGVVSGNLNDTSDENLKENIEDLGASTDIIKALKPRKFDWKQTSAGSDIVGFIAQEVATVIPSAVVGNDYVADSLYEDGDTIPEGFAIGDIKSYGDKGKALNTTAILAHAVKTIQELEARIKILEG